MSNNSGTESLIFFCFFVVLCIDCSLSAVFAAMLWLFTTTKATKCLFECNHQCFAKALPSNNLRTFMLFICSIKLKVSLRDQTILSLFTCSRLPIIISSLFHKRIRGTILKRRCLLVPCSGLCCTCRKFAHFLRPRSFLWTNKLLRFHGPSF